ncbi:MAG: DUF350 domain-containing protein [Bacteriovoracaceae bacterium]|nr:DUF350 domain-containing protein [Bacteriovoracaceae bacterium]
MEFQIVFLNFLYAIVGGILTIVFMTISYKVFDWITPFNTAKELSEGNRAVGAVIQGMLIGIGVAVGLVIGLGLN